MVSLTSRQLISVALTLGALGCGRPADTPLVSQANAQRSSSSQSASLETSRRTAIVDAAAKVSRSVVSISASTR